ncbi:GLPGLI family protein [uncultured Duncaniella sp.]|jgi:GLPGLI family protein|uniref:GLPGLI family protein n=1 Tax=Duncaniella dubosii TaxID=2518971 RepID=UPI0025B0856F|nr:GLPGLI family protein [uncultured Duncaniella sp.]
MKLIVNITSIILLLFIASGSIEAQSLPSEKGSRPARLGKIEIVDKSVMECVYEHSNYDPFFDETRIEDWILEIGRKASRYGNYNDYLRDSIFVADYNGKPTLDEFDKVSKKVGSCSLTETLKIFNENKLNHYEGIFGDYYVYTEELPEFDWKISNETDEICGYRCRKATAEFRGRTWDAWYAEEIQISNGPLKFGGLPGLILKIEDEKKEHIFEAIQLRKSNKDFGYQLRSFRIPTDRKTFNKMMYDFRSDVSSFFLANPSVAPTKADGSPAVPPKRRLFYNPVEID